MKYNKILTFSFDDCESYDRRLCDLLRKYGVKATFFLISGELSLVCDHFRYGEQTVVERVSPEELPETYRGMEVASHTSKHRCPIDDLKGSVEDSLTCLSSLCGYPVRGLAYPGGEYTQAHIQKLKKLPVAYARTGTVTHTFDLPDEWLAWNPTCAYNDENVIELADRFLHYSGDTPALFHIFGHSYELTQKKKGCDWESFEELLKKLSGRPDVWYATNIEVYDTLHNKNFVQQQKSGQGLRWEGSGI